MTSRLPADIRLRKAILADCPAIEALIGQSIRALGQADYDERQIEVALGSAFGVDRQLIEDQTCFLAESGDEIVGAGGWSWRRTLFGADAPAERSPELLDPICDGARIRAFFVHPDHARQGIGRAIYDACATEAGAAGFGSLELMATLPGARLYRALGFEAAAPITHELGDGVSIAFIPMSRGL